MRGIILIITLLALFISTPATAVTDTYLEAVQKTQKKSYTEAASLFRSQLEAFKDNPAYLNRTRIWLALSLLAKDDHSVEAETILQTVLCATPATKNQIANTRECSQDNDWSPTTQIDADMLSAAVAAYASIQWRQGEYRRSIQLLNLALQHALEAKPMDTDIAPTLKQLGSTPSTTPEKVIRKEQSQQTLIKEQMMAQFMSKLAASQGQLDDETLVVDSQTQQAFAASVMSEILAKQQIATHDTALKSSKDGQRLEKTAASEPEVFYHLATSAMCQHLDTATSPELNIKQMQQSFQESVAAMLEASRGQYLQSFKISQRPVLKSLNVFLDNKQNLPQHFNLFTQMRDSFLQNLGRCSDSLNLEESFNNALLVGLTRPARTHRNEQYLRLLISTAGRLRENRESGNPMEFMLERIEHQTMANFYLNSRQPNKAIPELQHALDKYKFSNQFALMPETAYASLQMAVRNLQGLIQAYQQSNKSLTELEPALQKLRGDMETLHTEVGSRLGMSSEQLLALQIEETKQAFNESPMLENIQSMLQNVSAMLPQSEQNSDMPNPLAKFNQMLGKLNGGDFDAAILEKVQNRSQQEATLKQQDVYGGLLEHQYQLYNSHAQLLLLFTQIELDLNKPNVARQKIDEAETYLQAHSGWISERSKAYHQFTLARLLTTENKATEASQAFSKAVNGWYFTPYSMIEKIFSILENETEIIEYAVAFSINQGEIEQAFNYLELARETNWKNGQLYGALISQDLVAEDQSLQQQALNLQKAAAVQAKERDETREFESTLKKAAVSTQQNHRQKIDPAYAQLTFMEFLTPWLNPEELGKFVANTLQQVARKQSANLNQKRIDFLYQQQEMTASKVTHHPSTPRMDNAMTLSTRIQQKISDDTLLVSIWMGRDTSYVVALDKENIRAHQQPTPPLLNLAKAFNKSYTQQHGYKLFQKLLAPYLSRHYDSLVLITNGSLQNTAFAALSTDPNNQAWLGDKYLLRSLPRAAQMLTPNKPKSDPVKILVLDASSVPGKKKLSATEIDTIIENFSSTQIANEKLTKKNLMENLPQYPVVHFAGHSEINHEFPDFSHLTLYEDKAYLLELEQLSLNKVRLIVLGSCESAAHADSNANNPFSSLQESLLSAGAESVLANLFPVDDRIASELLSHFYKLLVQGVDKDSALQQAQQLIRANNPNPKDWAGFVLSGSKWAL